MTIEDGKVCSAVSNTSSPHGYVKLTDMTDIKKAILNPVIDDNILILYCLLCVFFVNM